MTTLKKALMVGRGNTWRPRFVFVADGVPFAILPEDDLRFRVCWPDGGLVRRRSDGGIRVSGNTADAAFASVETRLIPFGALGYMELEYWRAGVERTVLTGKLGGQYGLNEDGTADAMALLDAPPTDVIEVEIISSQFAVPPDDQTGLNFAWSINSGYAALMF